MAYFYNADLIISPHGAGLANLMFCKESTRVIELCSKTMTHMKHFEHIAAVMKLNYTRFQDVIPDSESNDSNMTVKLEYFKLLEQANYLRTFALSNCPLLSILHG
jgi:capsular polysaccharide biosynthesis protein